MIRRFLPKGTSFKGISAKEIEQIEKWINNYPRKIFRFETAEQRYLKEVV